MYFIFTCVELAASSVTTDFNHMNSHNLIVSDGDILNCRTDPSTQYLVCPFWAAV